MDKKSTELDTKLGNCKISALSTSTFFVKCKRLNEQISKILSLFSISRQSVFQPHLQSSFVFLSLRKEHLIFSFKFTLFSSL